MKRNYDWENNGADPIKAMDIIEIFIAVNGIVTRENYKDILERCKK